VGRTAHSPLQSNSPVQPQNNRGNTKNKQAEKGSWLKQVGEVTRVEKVKNERQGVVLVGHRLARILIGPLPRATI